MVEQAAPSGARPISRFYMSQRRKLHFTDWGNSTAPTLVLVHGRRDHSRNWDWVAAELRAQWHVVAVDLCGHGDSEWCDGGVYTLPSYIFDLSQLVRHLGKGPVSIIAHSLGGNIALRFAASFPDLVHRIIAIEGLGPSPEKVAGRQGTPMATHIREWVEERQQISDREPSGYASLDEALARMRSEHPLLPFDKVKHLTRHAVTKRSDGRFYWKFDKLVRSFAPTDLGHSFPVEIWSEIVRPTLLIYGTESWTSNPLEDGRLSHFPSAELEVIENAGHWVHHDRLEAFLSIARRFLNDG